MGTTLILLKLVSWTTRAPGRQGHASIERERLEANLRTLFGPLREQSGGNGRAEGCARFFRMDQVWRQAVATRVGMEALRRSCLFKHKAGGRRNDRFHFSSSRQSLKSKPSQRKDS